MTVCKCVYDCLRVYTHFLADWNKNQPYVIFLLFSTPLYSCFGILLAMLPSFQASLPQVATCSLSPLQMPAQLLPQPSYPGLCQHAVPASTVSLTTEFVLHGPCFFTPDHLITEWPFTATSGVLWMLLVHSGHSMTLVIPTTMLRAGGGYQKVLSPQQGQSDLGQHEGLEGPAEGPNRVCVCVCACV